MNRSMALEWLKAAYDDLMLTSNIMGKADLTHLAAFHSQQCIEKSLKAVLEYHREAVPKKHDLIVLRDLVLEYLEITDEDILESLNSLYIESRYPSALGGAAS